MKQRTPRAGVAGACLILVTLAVLALAAFGALCLSGASADAALGKKSTRHLTATYTAQTQCWQAVADADRALAGLEDAPAESWPAACRTALEEQGWEWTDQNTALFTCPIPDTDLVWQAELEPLSPAGLQPGEGYYRLLSFRTLNTAQWQADETLPVYGADLS